MKTKIKELEIGDVIKLKKGTLLNFSCKYPNFPFYSRLMERNGAEVIKRNDNSFGIKLFQNAITTYFDDETIIELDEIISCRLPLKMNKGLKVKVLKKKGFDWATD